MKNVLADSEYPAFNNSSPMSWLLKSIGTSVTLAGFKVPDALIAGNTKSPGVHTGTQVYNDIAPISNSIEQHIVYMPRTANEAADYTGR
jgi:hypothetical protein